MATTTVKVFYNDDIRRITLTDGQVTYTQLLQTIFNLYPTLKGTSFLLKYKDSEGDFISLTSQPDFEEALAQLPSPSSVLRLFVHLLSNKPAPPQPATSAQPTPTPEQPKKPAEPQLDFDVIGAQAQEVLAQFGVPEDEAKEMVNSGLSFVRAFLQPQPQSSCFASSCAASCASAFGCNQSSRSCTDAKSTSNGCGSKNSEAQCSYATSGKRYVPQHWFNCLTCGLARGEGCCGICAKTCHAGHHLVYAGVTAAYCDCGAGARGSCKSLKSTETTSTTSSTEQEEKPYQIPVRSEKMETEEEEEETCTCQCGGEEEEEGETETKEPTPFEEKLKALEDMGFSDRSRNIRALIAHRGDVNGAIAEILNGTQY